MIAISHFLLVASKDRPFLEVYSIPRRLLFSLSLFFLHEGVQVRWLVHLSFAKANTNSSLHCSLEQISGFSYGVTTGQLYSQFPFWFPLYHFRLTHLSALRFKAIFQLLAKATRSYLFVETVAGRVYS